MVDSLLDENEIFMKIVDNRTGIVKNLTRSIWYNDEPKIYHFNVEMCNTGVFSEVDNKNNFPSGASFDKKKALIKAIGEAIERYCLGIYNRKMFIRASYAELKDEAIDIFSIVNFSEKQLKNKEFQIFRYNENSKFWWIRGFSLTQKREIFVPAQLVYVPYKFIKEKIIRFPISTGAAAGTSLSFALLRGIYEVIEREAFIVNYLNMLPREKVEIEEPIINKIKRVYSEYNLELHVINITTDIPVYTFLAIIVDKTGKGPAVSVGAKTFHNPIEAFVGAVEEAQPSRVWIRDLMKNSKTKDKIKKLRNKNNWKKITTFEERGLLWCNYEMINYLSFWLKDSKTTQLNSLKNTLKGKSEKILHKLIKFLKRKEIEVIYVDLTTPDIGILGFKVVKVIIPQLHPLYFEERFKYLGGERLYKIPEYLGYEPKNENELNKVPHPFL